MMKRRSFFGAVIGLVFSSLAALAGIVSKPLAEIRWVGKSKSNPPDFEIDWVEWPIRRAEPKSAELIATLKRYGTGSGFNETSRILHSPDRPGFNPAGRRLAGIERHPQALAEIYRPVGPH